MIDQIIFKILQLLKENETSKKSLSVRFNEFWAYKRPDDNVFALASTLFILQNHRQFFSKKSEYSFLEIEKIIKSKYKLYQNPTGRPSFNFYKTQPSAHFPNGYFMKYFKHFKLPDDIDDSVLILMTGEFNTTHFEEFKETLSRFHTKTKDKHPTSLTNEIYCTWLGQNMPQETDVSTLCNMMYFVLSNNLPLNEVDNNTLWLLKQSINQLDKQTFWLSRHYGNLPLVLYHFARLFGTFPHLGFDKNKIIDLAMNQLKVEKISMNRLLLEVTLLKLGVNRKKITNINTSSFYFFIGAPLAPIKFLSRFAHIHQLHIYWKSEILNLALQLEYQAFFIKKNN